tara:strand:+ start:1037 stop:1261 length:225 start_codon:yes stop_codon:yes gene_type:complete
LPEGDGAPGLLEREAAGAHEGEAGADGGGEEVNGAHPGEGEHHYEHGYREPEARGLHGSQVRVGRLEYVKPRKV